jgi:hypothetical protein
MTQPLIPGTHVEIRPGAASAWGRRFPAGGQATVLALAVPDDMVGQEVFVLPDGDPSHHTLRLRVEDLTPIELEPTLAEQGRHVTPADVGEAFDVPLELLDARPTVPAAPPVGVGPSAVATGAQTAAGEVGLGAALRAWTFAKHETDGPTEEEWWDAHEALADRADALERDLAKVKEHFAAEGAENSHLRAQIERVRALADEYASGRGGPTAKRIRAALVGAQ